MRTILARSNRGACVSAPTSCNSADQLLIAHVQFIFVERVVLRDLERAEGQRHADLEAAVELLSAVRPLLFCFAAGSLQGVLHPQMLGLFDAAVAAALDVLDEVSARSKHSAMTTVGIFREAVNMLHCCSGAGRRSWCGMLSQHRTHVIMRNVLTHALCPNADDFVACMYILG